MFVADRSDYEPAGKGASEPPRYRITETRWGIWRVLTEHPIKPRWFDELPFRDLPKQLHDIYESGPVVRTFVSECYTLAPHHLLLWLFMRIIISFSGAASLYISSLLLDLVEGVIENRNPDPRRLLIIGSARILFSLAQWAAHESLDQCERVLRERIGRHMAAYKVRVYSRLDAPTSLDAGVKSRLDHLNSTDVGWKTLSGIIGSFTKVLTIASQVSVLIAVFRHEKGGAEFGLLALVQPLVLLMGVNDEGPMPNSGVYAVFQADANHKRMSSIQNIVTRSTYREEIVGSGLRDYFLQEYNRADKRLGNVSINDPWETRGPTVSYWRSALPWMTYDLPWILFAGYAYCSDGSVPLKALMLLEQSVSNLTYHLQEMMKDGRTVTQWLTNLRQVYEASDIDNMLKDGDVPYPEKTNPAVDIDGGMKIEFKDVSFAYPEASVPALRDMSFKIEPGQLCVIVGENGSGKSSTTKLLLRMFDPSSGEVLIDDRPIQDYKSDDLRQATSILWQDYQTFPLSIGENISIGGGDPNVSEADIRRAAELGNSAAFIDALPRGFKTEIEGTYPYKDTLYNAKPDSLLKTTVSEMENETRLSGGQWQRLALSRTFMKTKGVRLALYDEPSASLDPKAEFELFERLRAMKGQRTMLFITHRFGHLTKYADLILFMKDGTIVEKGSHQELLAAGGEYASLYNVQAKAFAPPSTASSTEHDSDPGAERDVDVEEEDHWSTSGSEDAYTASTVANQERERARLGQDSSFDDDDDTQPTPIQGHNPSFTSTTQHT